MSVASSLFHSHELRHSSVAMPLYRLLLSALIQGSRHEEVCSRHTAVTYNGRQSHMHQVFQL